MALQDKAAHDSAWLHVQHVLRLRNTFQSLTDANSVKLQIFDSSRASSVSKHAVLAQRELTNFYMWSGVI